MEILNFYFSSLALGIFLLIFLLNLCSKWFQRRIFSIKSWYQWIWHEVLNKKMFECMKCDNQNQNCGLLFICFIFVSIILVFSFYYQLYNKPLYNIIFNLLLFANILLLCVYIVFFKCFPYFKTIEASLRYPSSDNLSRHDRHIAIIFPHYTAFAQNLIINDCVSLLVEGFQKFQKNYRIYHIFEENDFYNAYYDDKVVELWILGHGDHGGLSYRNKGDDYIEYSKLSRVLPRKKFIVQLHCNDGDGTSLKEINRCDGFVSNYSRSSFQNRCYIIETLKTNIQVRLMRD